MINFIQMEAGHLYRIFSLGDSAITIDFGNMVDEAINKKIIALFHHFSEDPIEGITEVVPAYSSLTIYYDPVQHRKKISSEKTVSGWMRTELEARLQNNFTSAGTEERFVRIPVCYKKEFAPDLQWIA